MMRRMRRLLFTLVLLGCDGGATITQIMKATGWQKHTVRGAISGAIRKKLGEQRHLIGTIRGVGYRFQDEHYDD